MIRWFICRFGRRRHHWVQTEAYGLVRGNADQAVIWIGNSESVKLYQRLVGEFQTSGQASGFQRKTIKERMRISWVSGCGAMSTEDRRLIIPSKLYMSKQTRPEIVATITQFSQ